MAHFKFDLSQTMSNENWLLSKRLLKDGSKESLDEFEEMEGILMINHDKFEDDDGLST